MPEHFLALIKQYANLNSNTEAERVASQISDAIEVTLQEDRRKLFFNYAPDYLVPKKARLYSRVFDWNRSYRHATLIQRLVVTQSLSDEREAENRLNAYFTALKIVSGPKNFQRIYSILPPELQSIA